MTVQDLPVFPLVRYNEKELRYDCTGRHHMQRAKRFVLIAGVVVLVLFVAGIVVAAIFHVLLDVLYICLMILAVLMILATLFQVYSILMLVRTITTVRDEMKPLLASVQETIGVVRDTAKTAGQTVSTVGATTKFAQDIALGPSVHAAAAVVAGQQMLRVFFGKGQTKTRAELRRQQQMAAAEAAEAAAARGD
jgi:hypothetical protein